MLIDHLPPESALKTALRDGLTQQEWDRLRAQKVAGHGSWSHTDHMLAALHDRLGWVIYALYAVNSPQGHKPAEPTPMPRPGVGPVLTQADLDRQERERGFSLAYVQYLRDHQGAAPQPGWDWQAYAIDASARTNHATAAGDAPGDS